MNNSTASSKTKKEAQSALDRFKMEVASEIGVNLKEGYNGDYLPPDTNCLLSCFDHCIRSRDYVNVLVTSKHPRPQWLTMEQAVKHCTQGVGIWEWASNDQVCHYHPVMRKCLVPHPSRRP